MQLAWYSACMIRVVNMNENISLCDSNSDVQTYLYTFYVNLSTILKILYSTFESEAASVNDFVNISLNACKEYWYIDEIAANDDIAK